MDESGIPKTHDMDESKNSFPTAKPSSVTVIGHNYTQEYPVYFTRKNASLTLELLDNIVSAGQFLDLPVWDYDDQIMNPEWIEQMSTK